MGIYIKGMEMPTSCWECHFGHGDTGVCVVDFKNHGDWDAPHDCPLVPIPPHGDLIDRDALEPYILNGRYGYRLVYDEVDVAHAPPIVPAEEGE